MQKLFLVFIILLFCQNNALSKELSFQEKESLPSLANDFFIKVSSLNMKYEFTSHVNPFFIQGDFDGDGKLDVALMIVEKNSQKIGIAVIHSSSHKVFILGAGNSLNNGGDNFNWLDAWNTYPKVLVERGVEEEELPKLIGDAIYVKKIESASGLIYWKDNKYNWYQQGD
jgi:hypothetical protein